MFKCIIDKLFLLGAACLTVFCVSSLYYLVGPTSYEVNKADIQQAYLDAVDFLDECEYYKKTYPDRHRLTQVLVRVGFQIRIAKRDKGMEDACALAAIWLPGRTIVLLPNFFTSPGCLPWHEVIAHEILHFSDFPLHSLDENDKVLTPDQIYDTIDACSKETAQRGDSPSHS